MNTSNLVQRVALAAVGIPVLYYCLRHGGLLLFVAVDVILFFCLFEFITLARTQGYQLNWPFTILAGLAISWDAYFSQGANIPLILFATLIGSFLYGLARWSRSTLLANASVTVCGIFFIGFGFSSLLLIRHMPSGADYTVLVFVLIWICDTFAYFVGISLGKNRLWPHISPKKTVEGTVAGLVGAWAAAFAAKFIFLSQLSTVDCIALGAIAGILGQAGDLVESAFKRSVNVKDSSRFLPGHGGFLDRFDSFLFTAPSIYYYIRFVLQ